MQTPDVSVLLDTGEHICLDQIYREQSVALVFLRHLGCVFCRRHVSMLKRHPELNVQFVCMATPEEAAAFREKQQLERPFLCDSERSLYKLFNLGRAKTAQVIAPKVIMRSIGALRHGIGRPENDPLQLGGAFVIDTKGEIIWSHRQQDISDLARTEDIAAALQRAG